MRLPQRLVEALLAACECLAWRWIDCLRRRAANPLVSRADTVDEAGVGQALWTMPQPASAGTVDIDAASQNDLSTAARAAPFTHERAAVGKRTAFEAQSCERVSTADRRASGVLTHASCFTWNSSACRLVTS